MNIPSGAWSRSLLVKPLVPARVSAGEEVSLTPLRHDDPLPLVVEARHRHHLSAWLESQHMAMHQALLAHGGILFRGFDVESATQFGAAARSLTPDLLGYLERAAARTEVAPNVFTSTELAADQVIPHHHEMSYSHNWPRFIWFFAQLPAAAGGATPIASERRFFAALDAGIKRRFLEHGVLYVRNYGVGLDLTWQEAFQTETRADVEAYCRRFEVAFEWTQSGGIRTRQVRQAVARHPITHETVWFNHAHLFHESNLGALREPMLAAFGSDGLPRNAYYGDGSPIEDRVLEEIRQCYAECSLSFEWRTGDVLVLDNYLSVHGRERYREPRRILVAMAQLCDANGVVQ